MPTMYFSCGSSVPVPWSVAIVISLGSLTKLNCWGSKLWFSITSSHLAAVWLNVLPKSRSGGEKVIALTVNTHSRLNLTGKT